MIKRDTLCSSTAGSQLIKGHTGLQAGVVEAGGASSLDEENALELDGDVVIQHYGAVNSTCSF